MKTLLAVVASLLVTALAGCGSDCAAGCSGSNGNCMSCPSPYSCNTGGTCSAVVNGVACCTNGGGGSGVCAHWSCGSSTQCAQTMGASSGVQCQFAPGQSCQSWCSTYIPGNCSCY